MPNAGPGFREVAPGSVTGPGRQERERVAHIDLAVAVEVGGAVHAGTPCGAQRLEIAGADETVAVQVERVRGQADARF